MVGTDFSTNGHTSEKVYVAQSLTQASEGWREILAANRKLEKGEWLFRPHEPHC